MASPKCNRNGTRGRTADSLTADDYPTEEDFAEAGVMTEQEAGRLISEQDDLLDDLEAAAIREGGVDDEDARAEIEHWDRRREDWYDVEDVLDEMGCGRNRDHGGKSQSQELEEEEED